MAKGRARGLVGDPNAGPMRPATYNDYPEVAKQLYPGASAFQDASKAHTEDAAIGTLRKEADTLYGPQLKVAESDIYTAANAINPTAARTAVANRETDYRNNVMRRAGRLRALGTAAQQAPSVEAARTGAIQSQAANARQAAIAGGRSPLEQRNAMGAAANIDSQIIGDAAARQGQEGVRDLAERGQYASGAGGLGAGGAGTSTALLGAAGNDERAANLAQTQITTMASDLYRDKQRRRAAMLGKAGELAVEGSGRRGVADASVEGAIRKDLAGQDAYEQAKQDIEKAKEADMWRQVGTTGMGLAMGFASLSDRRFKRNIKRMSHAST